MTLKVAKRFPVKVLMLSIPVSGVAILVGDISPALAEKAETHVNLVVNGSFESPGSGCVAGATSLPGWTINSGNIDIINSACTGGLPAADGTYYLDLTGSHAENGVDDVGVISQYIATQVGQKYHLSFEFGGNPQAKEFSFPNDSELKALAVFLNGAIAGVYSVHTERASVTNPQWRRHEISFTATSASTQVMFQSLNGSASNPSDFGPLLDAVDVSPVEGHED
jgi:choice-of-anchor C domain-containing protein